MMLITWMATCKALKLDYSLTSYTKINCKWIKDLNIKTEAIKSLENIRSTLWHGLSNVFLDISPQVSEAKQNKKINKCDYIKLKRCCTTKKAINKKKRQPTEWDKIFANYVHDKGLISKLCVIIGKNTKISCNSTSTGTWKMLNTANHQKKGKWNHNKIPYTCQPHTIREPHTSPVSYHQGSPLVVHWLRLHASNAVGTGLIPGWGTKIPSHTCRKRTALIKKTTNSKWWQRC